MDHPSRCPSTLGPPPPLSPLCRHDSLFECLELELPWNNYSTPVQAWLDAFPRRQLLLLQYERLTDPDREASHLRTVKRWAGRG